jgi:pimeloyl-ACP methyl ester carboxylesterase
MTFTVPQTTLGFDEPAGLSPRGTLIVLAGRGESAGVYERFGRRISADSWRVRVIDDARDAAAARDQALALLADGGLPAPRVLVGSDAGAALALQVAAAHPDSLDALILVGLPTNASHRAAGSEAELRSACPVHGRTLEDASLVEPGALGEELAAEFALPPLVGLACPVLAIHGDADAVVPLPEAVPAYRSVSAQILVVRGARHDALNDVSHRSVAASIVLFLEQLKAKTPIVTPLVE